MNPFQLIHEFKYFIIHFQITELDHVTQKQAEVPAVDNYLELFARGIFVVQQ